MLSFVRRAARWSVIPVLILPAIFALNFRPHSVSADTDLNVGGQAIIADANGDRVRLRKSPGTDAAIVARLSEGTVLEVLDGPTEADDGSLWYQVSDGDDTGYMISDYLSSYSSGGDTTTISDLNLRDGPSTADDVLLVMPPGASVSVDGDPKNGFYPVTYKGTSGWAYSGYLDINGGSGNGETTTVLSSLNLRGGPSTSDDVLAVMPEGAVVELTGDEQDGFFNVIYKGTEGWAWGGYLEAGSDNTPPITDEATTTSDLNLRAGPSKSDDVLDIMPPGATVGITGDPENGFYPVVYNGQSGWASKTYLDFGGAAEVPESDFIWPVSGGEWMISQGYHGSSHVNLDSIWQYDNSFDIVRTDGNTAGQPVYSPVNGNIRWTEQSSGGISIDMGNGYAAAIFHITVDPSLSWGDKLTQGQYIGFISGPGQDGNMGFDHLHLTVWATDDGGNWSRTAVPFVGQNAINGVEYPDEGTYSDWYGTIFYP